MYQTNPGNPHLLGATVLDEGVNFALFSEHATNVELLLFENHTDKLPFASFELSPVENKTFHIWHIFICGLKAGTLYGYRIDGPRDQSTGDKFNPQKLLLDPYAKAYSSTLWNRADACGEKDNLQTSMRSIVLDYDSYDWEGDSSPQIQSKDSIIYEMHVAGFTLGKNSHVTHPGTFKGVIEKIPYLKELGITAVEFLPIQEFDESEILKINNNGEELKNYWGYSTIGFFAPDAKYCVHPNENSHLDEFRDMVKALHREGIEVILDVVYNHTNEGNHMGPWINLKGIDNSVYYHTVPTDRQYYMDYTGCGNTLNCNHPIVSKMILDSLRFWVEEMHVDGFRFDEGSILSRGEDGAPLKHPPVLWNIELEKIFADTKLIAEAWDAGGLYQIGQFPGYRWAEWNGKYRDAIRSYIKGDFSKIGEVAARISGSSDLYAASGHLPINSINFITCHDGFTLYDLTAYNEKHNEANGENNQDGISENLSWNYGYEGETENQEIVTFRKKQIKNFAALLFLSQGTPMILSGDEMGNTQYGNNNAYCQNNQTSWLDWSQLDSNKDIFDFFKKMIALRKSSSSLRRGRFFDGKLNKRGIPDISWHGCKLNSPGWNDSNCRVLSFTLGALEDEGDIHAMFNMSGEDLRFEVPTIEGKEWYLYADTAINHKEKITKIRDEYYLSSFSSVILVNKQWE